MQFEQIRNIVTYMITVAATLFASEGPRAQDGGGDTDPCLCANQSRQTSRADELIYTVQSDGVTIVIADIYPTFHHAKPGKCNNGPCQDGKDCETSFDLTLTIHDDAALRAQTNSNALRFDGRIVSVQRPHTQEVRKKTTCGTLRDPGTYTVTTWANTDFLSYQYEFTCKACTAAGAQSGD